ncbi:hypothetical protein IIA94_00410 [Patescibacteria group bacterium]|nr:hypothetical protein [Patescibacteria group bacterium]
MQAVIIAAGESSRFWPLSNKHKHKSQIQLLGKSLIYWTIKGLVENRIKDIVVVRSPHSTIQEMLDKENDLGANISYKVQEKPLGSGDALYQAKDSIKEPFFVLWPSKINSQEIVRKMLDTKAETVLVGAQTKTPWDYGVIRMEGEKVVEIVENPAKGKEPSNIKAIGAYFLQPDFFLYYEKISKHHEADFIETLNAYVKDKSTSLIQLDRDAPTLKYPWELFGMLDIMRGSDNFKEQRGKDVEIGENVVIKGSVYIGNSVRIGAHTVIEGPAYIGDNSVIGYSNVLRGPLSIESGCITGAFMEIKHSIVQKDSHFHSGYLGDSLVGENCRFGAGFISANKRFDRTNVKVKIGDEKIDTGLDAFGCAVGDGATFGIHSGTMPGVLIGSDSVINPGVQVFENVSNKIDSKPRKH